MKQMFEMCGDTTVKCYKNNSKYIVLQTVLSDDGSRALIIDEEDRHAVVNPENTYDYIKELEDGTVFVAEVDDVFEALGVAYDEFKKDFMGQGL